MKKSGERLSVNIPLEIAVDYPIGWNFKKALRDFVQNFYDSVGTSNFYKEVIYEIKYDEKERCYSIRFSTKNRPFSYELLSYIGASSKRNDDSMIGKYGEGFKMAALYLYCTEGMSFSMHSEDWILRPASYYVSIDDKKIEMFGYNKEQLYNDGITSLTITGIPFNLKEDLDEALLDFFFPENELFEEKIGEGKNYCVYRRSTRLIPCKQYAHIEGILYINNLARGRLNIPIIVNWNGKISGDKRNRPTLDYFETVKYLYKCIEEWDAETSAKVLRIMKKYWNDTTKKNDNIYTNYYIVCQLVRNIADDPCVRDTFFPEMQKCCYLEKKGNNNIINKQISEAEIWWKNNGNKKLVNPIFRKLGAESVLEQYRYSKASNYRNLESVELKRYELVVNCITEITDLINEKDIPKAVIDISGKEKMIPLQFATKKQCKKKEHKKYQIEKIVLVEDDFKDKAFYETFLKISNALLQIYGTERSAKLNALFTYYATYILKGDEAISLALEKWNSVGGGNIA